MKQFIDTKGGTIEPVNRRLENEERPEQKKSGRKPNHNE